MLRCNKIKKIWDVDIDNVVISKLIKTKNKSKDLNRYLVEIITPLILISRKMSRYVKTFRAKNKKLMSLSIDDDQPLEKYKTIWTKIVDRKNTKPNALPVHDIRYINNKIRTYSDQVHTNFCGLSMPDNKVECGTSTTISIDFLRVFENN